jgi:hypothetical protein
LFSGDLNGNATSATTASKVSNSLIIGTQAYDGSSAVTVGDATISEAGLMSYLDKAKLDGIASNANNYSLPIATSSILGGIKSGGDITVNSSTGVVTVGHATSAATANKVDKSLIINGKTYDGSSETNVGTIGVPYGGTGKTSWTANSIVYAVNSTALGQLGLGTSGWVLTSGGNSNAPSWTQVASSN